MATMPDLDLNEVGVMAWWNIEDDGYDVDTINWDDITEEFDTYTAYDNGYIGELWDFTSQSDRDITVRVKTDGWFVAYLDDTEQEETGEGPWDMYEWTASANESDIALGSGDDELREAIDRLLRGLEENPDVLPGDIYYYNADTPDATNLTLLTNDPDNLAEWQFTVDEEVALEAVYVTLSTFTNWDKHFKDVTNNEYIYEDDDPPYHVELIATDDVETGTTYELYASGDSVGQKATAFFWWW